MGQFKIRRFMCFGDNTIFIAYMVYFPLRELENKSSHRFLVEGLHVFKLIMTSISKGQLAKNSEFYFHLALSEKIKSKYDVSTRSH